ncbi:hypothetical protein D6783_01770 [Candidatus Woesearchaeota archaeon]|nr:MAG: hypothetical protein D6783_01770 [Candidatus Woesearchaeota archaeon]
MKNVKELAEVLEHLEDEVFRHHVRDDGHDFATWVRDVFKDVELAEKLARARDKHHLRLEIYKHVTKKYFREK